MLELGEDEDKFVQFMMPLTSKLLQFDYLEYLQL